MQSSILRGNWAYVFLALLLSTAFLLTVHPFTYEQAITRGFSDVIDYMAIANAPDLASIHQFSLTHAMHRLERWPLHFLMGRLSSLSGINVWEVERIFVLLGMGVTLVLIGSLRVGLWQKLAIYALLIFSPYAFRQYYAVPGMLSDCFFYVAIVGLAVGMWKKQWILIGLAICCACFLRQTGVLLLPLIAIFCFVEKISYQRGMIVIGLGILSFGASKVLSFLVFEPISGGYVAMHTLGIFFWLLENPHWHDLVDFLGRYGLMLLTLCPILVLINRIDRLTTRDWMYVAFFFFLHTQPLLAGPAVSGSNVDRLAIYGLPFLALLLITGSNQFKWVGLFIALVFLESLLPNFSILHGIAQPRIFFVSIVVLVTLISLWIRKDRLSKLAL
jgi:hypothetical protein